MRLASGSFVLQVCRLLRRRDAHAVGQNSSGGGTRGKRCRSDAGKIPHAITPILREDTWRIRATVNLPFLLFFGHWRVYFVRRTFRICANIVVVLNALTDEPTKFTVRHWSRSPSTGSKEALDSEISQVSFFRFFIFGKLNYRTFKRRSLFLRYIIKIILYD